MRPTLAALSLVAVAYVASAASPARAAAFRQPFPDVDAVVSRAGISPVSFRTYPNARCILGADRVKATFAVYADDRGLVAFHFTPKRGGAANGTLHARCDARGRVSDVALRVHVVATVRRAPLQPQIAFDARPLVPRGTDPATLSETDLKAMQLPPRPDARRDPKNYADWLRAVTTPVRRIGGTTVLRRDLVHGPMKRANLVRRTAAAATKNGSYTSDNWSGIVDFGGSGQFTYWVAGKWTVPAVSTDASDSPAYSSVWDGIDGSGSGDVIQNGTEQDAYSLGFFGSFSFYSAWYEFYPDGGSTTLPNFNVSPGDQIYAVSWLCYDGQGQRYGCYYMENMTQGEATPVYYELGQQPALFAGNSAEWVVERPTVNGNLNPLPQFNLVPISWEHVYDSYAGAGRNSCDENQNDFAMYNGADELSIGIPFACDTSITFWNAFQ